MLLVEWDICHHSGKIRCWMHGRQTIFLSWSSNATTMLANDPWSKSIIPIDILCQRTFLYPHFKFSKYYNSGSILDFFASFQLFWATIFLRPWCNQLLYYRDFFGQLFNALVAILVNDPWSKHNTALPNAVLEKQPLKGKMQICTLQSSKMLEVVQWWRSSEN